VASGDQVDPLIAEVLVLQRRHGSQARVRGGQRVEDQL